MSAGRVDNRGQLDLSACGRRAADALHADQSRCAESDAVVCGVAREVRGSMQFFAAGDDPDAVE